MATGRCPDCGATTKITAQGQAILTHKRGCTRKVKRGKYEPEGSLSARQLEADREILGYGSDSIVDKIVEQKYDDPETDRVLATANFKRQTQAMLITSGGRKAFEIKTTHKVIVQIGIIGVFENDDLIDAIQQQYGVTAKLVHGLHGYYTYAITASDVPSLDRAVNHLEEAGYLKDPV